MIAEAPAWQCPQCPFYVTGNPTDAILAEIQRSHGRRHPPPPRRVT